MNSTAELPYELHTHGSGAFVIFNVADQIAFPLLTLGRATLRTTQAGDELRLEFQDVEVVLEGRGLASMLDHLLAGRVKRVSCAHDHTCHITAILFTELTR
jgi:hypothetical protein